MNRDDYIFKINNILNDRTKFKKIQKDPTKLLKAQVNRLIESVNGVSGQQKLNKIIGEYEPGYIYGNVKTHKAENPLRPIISQIPTPSYKLAKKLNDFIRPYIPSDYSLKSTDEFIDLLRSTRPEAFPQRVFRLPPGNTDRGYTL